MITLYLDVTIFTEHLPPKLFYAFWEHTSKRVTFFQFISADKKLWEMAESREFDLFVVIGGTLFIHYGFFSLLFGRRSIPSSVWEPHSFSMFSCKKSEMRFIK